MDREALEDIIKKTFEGKQEVLLIGKESKEEFEKQSEISQIPHKSALNIDAKDSYSTPSKIYIDTKGEPVFLEDVALPGLLIITQEQDKLPVAQILGEPKKYSHYCFGAELRVSESHGFAIVYKEIVAVDFLREIN